MIRKQRAAKHEPSEHDSQRTVCDWWRIACNGYGLPEFALMAVPNGAHLAGDAKGRAIKMANLKRTGLRPGVPDLFLAVPKVDKVVPELPFPGLWIEMKKRPNKPSPEQEAVILYLRQRGYHVCICYSAEEAIRAISAYLKN